MHIHLVREDASLPFVLSKTHDAFVQKLNTYKGTSDIVRRNYRLLMTDLPSGEGVNDDRVPGQ